MGLTELVSGPGSACVLQPKPQRHLHLLHWFCGKPQCSEEDSAVDHPWSNEFLISWKLEYFFSLDGDVSSSFSTEKKNPNKSEVSLFLRPLSATNSFCCPCLVNQQVNFN